MRLQFHRSSTGSPSEREDWWYLVYDTDAQAFHIEHEWSHKELHLSFASMQEGHERLSADRYVGPGSDKLHEVKADLLARYEIKSVMELFCLPTNRVDELGSQVGI